MPVFRIEILFTVWLCFRTYSLIHRVSAPKFRIVANTVTREFDGSTRIFVTIVRRSRASDSAPRTNDEYAIGIRVLRATS